MIGVVVTIESVIIVIAVIKVVAIVLVVIAISSKDYKTTRVNSRSGLHDNCTEVVNDTPILLYLDFDIIYVSFKCFLIFHYLFFFYRCRNKKHFLVFKSLIDDIKCSFHPPTSTPLCFGSCHNYECKFPTANHDDFY